MSLIRILKTALLLFAIEILVACGGGGGGSSPPQTPSAHQVILNWTANLEADVNAPGGGYTVVILGHNIIIDVPYPHAPNLVLNLTSGQYNVTVTAYSSTNPVTGMTTATGANFSPPSEALFVNVP